MRVLLLLVSSFLILFTPMRTHTTTHASLGGNSLELEVVSGVEEKAKGLSGRALLPENHGMLFVYESDTQPAFWMKDMRFPIDIIWISGEKKVVGVEADVSPSSYPMRFRPEAPVRFAVEVNAGWSSAHGVTAGDAVEF